VNLVWNVCVDPLDETGDWNRDVSLPLCVVCGVCVCVCVCVCVVCGVGEVFLQVNKV
jgi:hypothetical protein